MLRDQIIIVIFDKKLQLKLLDGRDDPLRNVIETCKVYEAAYANKEILDSRSPLTVNAVSEEQQIDAVHRSCFNCGWN